MIIKDRDAFWNQCEETVPDLAWTQNYVAFRIKVDNLATIASNLDDCPLPIFYMGKVKYTHWRGIGQGKGKRDAIYMVVPSEITSLLKLSLSEIMSSNDSDDSDDVYWYFNEYPFKMRWVRGIYTGYEDNTKLIVERTHKIRRYREGTYLKATLETGKIEYFRKVSVDTEVRWQRLNNKVWVTYSGKSRPAWKFYTLVEKLDVATIATLPTRWI